MLTDREAFKSAFIARCIEEGFTTPAQVHTQVKQALDSFKPQEKKAFLGGAVDALSNAAGWAIPVAAAAPPMIGAGLGYAAARAGDVDDADVSEMKRQELIDELRRHTRQARRRNPVKDYRKTVSSFARPTG